MKKSKVKLQKRFDGVSYDVEQTVKLLKLGQLTPKFKRTGWIQPVGNHYV